MKNIRKLKIKRWLEDGHEGLSTNGHAIGNVEALLDVAGRVLDDACSSEIMGPVLFQGANGKYYVGTVEFCVDEANPEYVREVREELGELKPKKRK